MYRTDFWTLWEKGRMFWENSIETSVLSRVKQITSPGWIHETGAQGWCTGKTQRNGMGREAGGGIRMGNTCKNPWLIHVNVWQKPLQYCKVISLQLIKIKNKKNFKIRDITLPIKVKLANVISALLCFTPFWFIKGFLEMLYFQMGWGLYKVTQEENVYFWKQIHESLVSGNCDHL